MHTPSDLFHTRETNTS